MTQTDSDELPHPYTPGTIRAAWSYRPFRVVWTGQAMSQTGTDRKSTRLNSSHT